MPFAELPSSGGFQLPPTPDWTKFASQANEFIAHRPIPDYTEAVQQATGQINEVLKMMSPEGRLERKLKMLTMATMAKTYEDYQLHPEKYTLTAHGPVHNDPDTELYKAAHIKQALSATALNMEKLRQAQSAGSTGDFIAGLRSKASNFFGSKDYGNLPVNSKEPATAVGGPSGETPTDLTPTESTSPFETPSTSESEAVTP